MNNNAACGAVIVPAAGYVYRKALLRAGLLLRWKQKGRCGSCKTFVEGKQKF